MATTVSVNRFRTLLPDSCCDPHLWAGHISRTIVGLAPALDQWYLPVILYCLNDSISQCFTRRRWACNKVHELFSDVVAFIAEPHYQCNLLMVWAINSFVRWYGVEACLAHFIQDAIADKPPTHWNHLVLCSFWTISGPWFSIFFFYLSFGFGYQAGLYKSRLSPIKSSGPPIELQKGKCGKTTVIGY